MNVASLAVSALWLSALPAVSQAAPLNPTAQMQAQVTVPVQTTPAPAVQPTPVAPTEAGLEFTGIGTPNIGKIVDTIFRGECPGEAQGNIKARFYSTATPPAPGRRVVIRNISRGLDGESIPFTDRDYSKGRTSESTSVEFGTKHKLTNFVVLEGVNTMEYAIKQGDRVIEQGTFTVQLSRDERTRSRNATCSDEKYCRNSENTPLNKCDSVRTRSRCSCPNSGRTFIRDNRW